MPPRKRSAPSSGADDEAVPKRRSLRQAASKGRQQPDEPAREEPTPPKKTTVRVEEKKQPKKPKAAPKSRTTTKVDAPKTKKKSQEEDAPKKEAQNSPRAASEDSDVDSIPAINPEAPRHDGQWYWLLKAEPETRIVNGIDVKFSIDDLRDKDEPEGWDGIRNYAARNNMRNMNVGDLAFFYASNCKEPGIMGTMEIVKEFSEDKSARQPGAPYYDPKSTKEKPIWDLVHVEFRKKFAVPIHLKELRELGKPGGPLEAMQLIKQSRLSVTKVSADEWNTLCELADKKASEAGLEHQGPK
ncbi:PUA-like domain-containing protein [Fusarium solani]|uniref:Thymocyte nuclear protein 1 n=1 Tax=Fusarium solani TaxID=169388 RepID=A0A9P9G2B9_FUSSL|nr:PUA-like domain-containing protein [Fusarium solani]KAH7231910.1 PUA-like domain-containing protein [Fusarium solani]